MIWGKAAWIGIGRIRQGDRVLLKTGTKTMNMAGPEPEEEIVLFVTDDAVLVGKVLSVNVARTVLRIFFLDLFLRLLKSMTYLPFPLPFGKNPCLAKLFLYMV
jgi:hypothetical protein